MNEFSTLWEPPYLGTWGNYLLHSPSASAEAYQDKGVCM